MCVSTTLFFFFAESFVSLVGHGRFLPFYSKDSPLGISERTVCGRVVRELDFGIGCSNADRGKREARKGGG